MPSFAEWQAQQGGGAPSPSPGGGGSFADWKAAQGGGGSGAAAPPPPDTPHEGIQHGPEDLRGLISHVGGDERGGLYQDEVDAGYLTAGEGASQSVMDNNGMMLPSTGTIYSAGPKAPKSEKYGALGNFKAYDVPSAKASGGMRLKNPDDWYYDPRYGAITPSSNVIDNSYDKTWEDYVGPIVMSAVLGGAGLAAGAAEAGAAGAATAAGAGDASAVAASQAIPAGTTAAQQAALGGAQAIGGGLQNTDSLGGAIGGAAGGYFGGSLGATAGNVAGQAIQHGPENVNWAGALGSLAGQYFKNPFAGQAASLLARTATGKPINWTSEGIKGGESLAHWLARQGG